MIFVMFALLSFSQDDSLIDPYRVFLESDSALSLINEVKYSFIFRGTGFLMNILPVLQGETSLAADSTTDHPLMLLRYNDLLRPGIVNELSVPSIYIAGVDSLYRIDVIRRKLYTGGLSPEGFALFNFPPASVLMEFVLDDPFLDELNADSIAVLVPEYIGGVLCHVFHVFYGGPAGSEAVWYIGMDDLLPRAVERIGYYGEYKNPGGQRLEIDCLFTALSEPFLPPPSEGFIRQRGISLPSPGDQAEEIFLADTDGFARRVSFPGDRAVLLCFFSSWDPESLRTLGILEALQGEYSDELDIYGISIWENNDPLFRLSGLDISFPVLLYGAYSAEDYGVTTVPSLVLVSPDGAVAFSCHEADELNSDQITVLLDRQ